MDHQETPLSHAGAHLTDDDKKRALDAALAEFASIRSIYEHMVTARLSLVGLNVTGIAAVGGFVLANHADPRLLLILPILCSALGLAMFGHLHDTRTASSYVDNSLRPLIVEYTGDDRLFQWEAHYQRHKDVSYLIQAFAMGLIFPGIGAVALAITVPRLKSAGDWSVWSLGAALVVALTAAGLTRVRTRWQRRIERTRPNHSM